MLQQLVIDYPTEVRIFSVTNRWGSIPTRRWRRRRPWQRRHRESSGRCTIGCSPTRAVWIAPASRGINGRAVQGAQPYAEFKQVIDDEIVRADSLIAQGTAPAQLYATFMKGAAPSLPAAPAGKGQGASAEVFRVPVGDGPRRGGVDPKVTIFEFSDFQCPFCRKVDATLGRLLADYGDDVRLVYRHNPLAFHADAMPAALAAEAARQQGSFWEMHDRLLANQQSLDRPSLDKYAQEIGLDLRAFRRSMDKRQGADRIQHDMDEAAKFGAVGTPNFFINGRNFRGAQPLEAFKRVIDDEIKRADAKLASGTPRAQLYAVLTQGGLDKAPPPPPVPGAPDQSKRYHAEIKSAPMQGAKDAPVTIVEWADFECPYCARVESVISRVMKEYKGKVRRVWRDQPLAFHANAMPAAIAARAAAGRGRQAAGRGRS